MQIPLQLQSATAGKLDSRPPVNNFAAGSKDNLLFVNDILSGRHFLIDTGAEISVLPATLHDLRYGQRGRPLAAANGTTIKSFGQRNLSLQIGSHQYEWTFTVADVNRPILGADFLRAHSLLVDLNGNRLMHSGTYASVSLMTSQHFAPHISAMTDDADSFSQMLASRPALTTPTFTQATVKHRVEHFIPTTGPPVHASARRLSPEKLAVAKTEFDNMEAMGIVRRSSSPWSSPLHVAPKANGGWRPCGDYRRLNNISIPDRYPIPHIQDMSTRLAGCAIFSKIDLIRGYHQIPVHEQDVPKTAVITPFGLYEFFRMPFGLKNAAQTFQRLMDTVCQGLDFSFVYLDDILVASVNSEEHKSHLDTLFNRLEEFGLVVNPTKCLFGVEEIEFLGHKITKHGVSPLPQKVEAIRSFQRPSSVAALQEFIGMVNFYHRFVPSAARLMQPFYTVVSSHTKTKKAPLEWNETLEQAFQATKEALAQATMLSHPLTWAPTALTVDASDSALGGVLEQYVNEQWCPLAFFSRQLRPPERRYSTFDRELLAIHLGIRHFRYFLEGRQFTIFTDHKPLTFAMSKISEPWSARQQRQLAAISEYSTDIQHVSGKNNPVADALSRTPGNIPVLSLSLGIDYEAMANAQQSDDGVKSLRTAATSLKLMDIPFGDQGNSLLCDTSTGIARPIVPTSFQRQIFDTLHGLSHPGIRATRRLISKKFVWHGLSAQINTWARNCVSCQKAKVHRHVKSSLEEYEPPTGRFSHINIDIVGPLPPSQGNSYLLTIVDRFTRWPEAIPLPSTDTHQIARAFLNNWLSRFGVPQQISSDRGPQFTSQLWNNICKLLGTNVNHTTAYHAQANGLVERFHRRLKESLKARLTGPNWLDHLPWIMLGIRTTLKEDLGTSAAELVYGTPITVPGDFVPTSNLDPCPDDVKRLREQVGQFRPIPMSTHRNHSAFVPSSLLQAKYVFLRQDCVRKPLQPPYIGPYKVLEPGKKTFKLQVGHRQETVSVDRLKPAYVDNDQPVEVAVPPARGRPVKDFKDNPAGSSEQPTPHVHTRRGRVVKPPDRFQHPP